MYALVKNGYPKKFIYESTSTPLLLLSVMQLNTQRQHFAFHYVWYLETIENGFEGCSHRSRDKATPDLEAKTCAPKEGIPSVEKSDGVYWIQCADCPATYVGETKRKLSKRLDDHNRVVKVADFNASAIVEYAWSHCLRPTQEPIPQVNTGTVPH